MLKWAFIFAVIAVIAGALGFAGAAGAAAAIAKTLAFVFLGICVILIVAAVVIGKKLF